MVAFIALVLVVAHIVVHWIAVRVRNASARALLTRIDNELIGAREGLERDLPPVTLTPADARAQLPGEVPIVPEPPKAA